MTNVNTIMSNADKKKICQQHMHRYVLVQTAEGWCDGFVEHVDDDMVYLAVPCGSDGMDERVLYPYGGPIYPYPYYPRRRFFRRRFPLGALLALSLLPFF
ncbi:hypothetical protein M6D81_03000 [Paenibacillus sp. J5C_2022]|uniref:hypothetical protein n=1 Tax=Paenibacillus sp. J5C2022 TaxID=2977129 RepID=UPI0021D20A9B|nr:hypothetical protein [Paenibacillus sp. J5C2022]MCU6707667.1 hypothetical protein [Paenibacillus sp. J5C2022]